MAACHPLNTRPKAVAGAYQLCDGHGEVIYMGKATNLAQRINDHATGQTIPCVASKAEGYRYWIGDPDQLEVQLFLEYKRVHGGRIPECNEQDPSA